MKKTVPKILIVFTQRRSENSTWFGGFVKRLQKRPGLEGINIDYVALEDLIFEIKDNKPTIFDVRTEKYIKDYTWAYFKRWMSMPDEAAALAIYLQSQGTPFADHSVINKNDGSKLVSQFRFWANNVPVADTIYCSPVFLGYALERSKLDYPLIIKDANGQKGELNFLVKTKKHALSVFNKHPQTKFLVQNYIDNKFDYRIQVYGGRAVVAVKRVGAKGSHLNNESAGGASSFIPFNKVPKKVFELAEKAAAAVELQVSGVDVLPNHNESKYAVLEANQGSQIVTGDTSGDQVAIIDEFNKYMAGMARSRIKHDKYLPSNKLQIVGLHEEVDLIDLGMFNAHAKVDTGAYRCSIHATNIKVIERGNKQILQFSVPEIAKKGKSEGELRHETEEFYIVPVKKSANHIEKRYIIKTRLRMGGRTFITSFTLTNRGSMRFPILIGRRVLSGRFLVNSALSTKE